MDIRIGGRKVKFRFFIINALLIVCILYILMPIFKEPSRDTVKQGEITLWHEAIGVIIRQEEVYMAPDYGKVDFFFPKGHLVDKDTPVGLLYRTDYDENLIEELYRIKSKVSDYQVNSLSKEMAKKDYQNIEKSIKTSLGTIQSDIKNGTIGNMERNEKELMGLLKRREDMLKEGETEDANLRGLYEEELDLQERLDKWKEELLSPKSGMLAYEMDGLEEILAPSVLDYLDTVQLQTFLDSQPEPPKDHEVNLDSPLFKVVDPSKWYIASLINQGNLFYDEGSDVKVRLTGLDNVELSGSMFKVDTTKDSTLVVLELTEGIEHILDIRDTRLEIGNQASGLMVARDAIIEKDNRHIVKVNDNKKNYEVEVKVLAMDDRWAIIEKINPQDSLDLNDSVLIY